MTALHQGQMAQQENHIAMASSASAAVRPALNSHHSISVPSTPSQRPRRFSLSARSPSPTKPNREHSPTARSEANSVSTSQRRGPSSGGCKYETGIPKPPRRMPYSIGSEVLERPTTMPRKYLNPSEEEKLSGDLRELYDRLLPSPASAERRKRFVQKLEKILNGRWPGNEIKVHLFGSSGNLLSTNDSDGTIPICSIFDKC